MKFGYFLSFGSLFLLAAAFAATVQGKTLLEDFEDGSYTDGTPASWTRYAAPFDRGEVIIQNGSLVITPPTSGTPHPADPQAWETDVYLQGSLYHDVNILTQVRALSNAPTAIGINAIDMDAVNYPNGSGVYALLVNDGNKKYLELTYGVGTSSGLIGQTPTNLDLFNKEVNMRLIIDGPQVAFTAWELGTSEPKPQLVGTLPLSLQNHQGYMGLYSIGRGTPAPAAFRYVAIVPEPTSGIGSVWGLLLLATRGRRLRDNRPASSVANEPLPTS